MILRSEIWDYEIQLYQDKVNLIVVSSLDYLFQMAKDLLGQENGEEGIYDFYFDDRNLRFDSEIELITDLYNLSLLNRKITTHLQKKLSKEISNRSFVDSFDKINKDITSLLNEIRKATLIHFVYSEEIGVEDFIKMYNVQYFDKYNNPYEMLFHYLEVMKNISKIKLLILFHPLEFLSEDHLNELSAFCQYSSIYLICISNINYEFERLTVSRSIIDQDMCYTDTEQ